jgi:hypothetical protein
VSISSTSDEQESLVQLLAAGDRDAAAGFFDARAPSVKEYCAELCPPDQVDQATLAAFVDFLGRICTAAPDDDPDELLRKATRTAAASRMKIAEPHEPTCRSIPDLIAARANAEMRRSEEPINKHLGRCDTCKSTAERLTRAEDALIRDPSSAPPENVRRAWLQIGSRQDSSVQEAESGFRIDASAVQRNERDLTAAESLSPEPAEHELQVREASGSEAAEPQSAEPEPEPAHPEAAEAEPQPTESQPASTSAPPSPVVVRRRGGGLVGAARRLGSSARRKPSQ